MRQIQCSVRTQIHGQYFAANMLREQMPRHQIAVMLHRAHQNLIALTDTLEFIPEVDTYGGRQLGGSWAPGMLIDNFTYTL